VSTVPSGWTDTVVNGDPQLHNSQNSFFVRGSFRTTVLEWPGGWEPWNVPEENEHSATQLEMSNPTLGPGVLQTFAGRRLEMVNNQGNKIIAGWLGQELIWYINKLAAIEADETAKITALNNQITALQAEIVTLQANGSGPSTQLQAAINTALTDAGQISQVISVATQAVNDLTSQLQQYKK
jgi:hypothetical protein